MKKAGFSLTDVVSKLPYVVPIWRYTKSILNFGPALDLPESEWTNVFNQTRVCYGLPSDSDERADMLKTLKVDLCVSANELNKRENLDDALAELATLEFDCCVIVVDEGNRTSKPTSSKRNGYHRNEPIEKYVRPIQQNFHRYDLVLLRNQNMVVISKGNKYYGLTE